MSFPVADSLCEAQRYALKDAFYRLRKELSGEILITYNGIVGKKAMVVKQTDTMADVLSRTWWNGFECGKGCAPGFELFLQWPSCKRLERRCTIASYNIQEGQHLNILPVNSVREFPSIEESLKQIRVMEH